MATAAWLLALVMASGASAGQPPTGRSAEPDGPPDHVPAKVLRYARRVVRAYDSQYGNGNGQLEPGEWDMIYDMTGAQPQLADLDGDGIITIEEMARHAADFGRLRRIRLVNPLDEDEYALPSFLDAAGPDSDEDTRPPGEYRHEPAMGPPDGDEPQAARRPPDDRRFYVPKARLKGLPEWFLLQDANGDGQLTLSEFATKPTREQLEQFAHYDRNGDGVITAREYRARAAPVPTPSAAEQDQVAEPPEP